MNKMDELQKIAEFIDSYREKIIDFDDYVDDYVYIDYEQLNNDILETLTAIAEVVKDELADMFMLMI